MTNIKVVKVSHGFFDVFYDDGWLNHVRVRMTRGDSLIIPDRFNIIEEDKKTITKLIKQGKTKFSN